MSLTFWGLASLSFVYAKGYPALLALRCARFPDIMKKSITDISSPQYLTWSWGGWLLCGHDLLLVVLVQKVH